MIWGCKACEKAREAMSAWMFGGPDVPAPRIKAGTDGHSHLVTALPHRIPEGAPLLLYYEPGLTEWLACNCGWAGLAGELILAFQAISRTATFRCPRCRRELCLLREPTPSEVGQRLARALSSPYADHD